jgi:hypothetical protein
LLSSNCSFLRAICSTQHSCLGSVFPLLHWRPVVFSHFCRPFLWGLNRCSHHTYPSLWLVLEPFPVRLSTASRGLLNLISSWLTFISALSHSLPAFIRT